MGSSSCVGIGGGLVVKVLSERIVPRACKLYLKPGDCLSFQVPVFRSGKVNLSLVSNIDMNHVESQADAIA